MEEVTIIGAGYVGITTAALMACSGMRVNLVEIDKTKVEKIRSGKSPFYEGGLDEIIQNALSGGNLSVTGSYEESVPKSKFVFCCVGTPDKSDGSSNLDYAYDALLTAAKNSKDGIVLIQKSTVPVGTGAKISKEIKKVCPALKFSYVSNPEFLREGSAIRDSLYPDRTILGCPDKNILQLVSRLYQKLYTAAPSILPGTESRTASDFVFTSLESAELIKVTANAFLALKISFANSIAKLSDRAGSDIKEVMDGVGLDARIGRAFLNAGRGYGGGCFPKDVSGLLATAAEYGAELEIMSAAVHVNDSMAHYILDKIEDKFTPVKGNSVAVLGLSFKAGTSDTRRSPAIKIANLLAEKGASVTAYDPQAILEGYDNLDSSVIRKPSLNEAINGAGVVLVATDWPEFLQMNWKEISSTIPNGLIVDCMNVLDKNSIKAAGLSYMGVGRD